MQWPSLQPARLLRRYKRFLADVELADGSQITVHCPNTGRMTGCDPAGARVWLLDSENPKRKYRYTWELVETAPGELACIHSARANALVEEALQAGLIEPLAGYPVIQREVTYDAELLVAGEKSSRSDFCLYAGETDKKRAQSRCFVEVKSVTLHCGNGVGQFPDAVSQRATRHVQMLARLCQQGERACLLFCVQHTGIQQVCPADDIDPAYGKALREAQHAGVDILAYATEITPEQIRITRPLPVVL